MDYSLLVGIHNRDMLTREKTGVRHQVYMYQHSIYRNLHKTNHCVLFGSVWAALYISTCNCTCHVFGKTATIKYEWSMIWLYKCAKLQCTCRWLSQSCSMVNDQWFISIGFSCSWWRLRRCGGYAPQVSHYAEQKLLHRINREHTTSSSDRSSWTSELPVSYFSLSLSLFPSPSFSPSCLYFYSLSPPLPPPPPPNHACSEGYIQGRLKEDRVLIYMGIIDILQSYRLKKKLEHTMKSVITDGVGGTLYPSNSHLILLLACIKLRIMIL